MSSSSNGGGSDGGSESGIKWLNIANVAAYVVNAGLTFGSQQFFPDNAELSEKYQTLVTPSGLTFAIWGIIFIAEFIFSVVQLLPKYRETAIETVRYNFILFCVAQGIWSLLFGAELILLSVLAMVAILIPLLQIVRSQESPVPLDIYWFLQFPFQIHCGWIIAATVLNINVVFVAQEFAAYNQLTAAWLSLIIVFVAAVSAVQRKVWVIAFVLAWASFGISNELKDPSQLIVTTFEADDVADVQRVTNILTYVILVIVLIGIVWERFIKKPDEDEDGQPPYHNANEHTALDP